MPHVMSCFVLILGVHRVLLRQKRQPGGDQLEPRSDARAEEEDQHARHCARGSRRVRKVLHVRPSFQTAPWSAQSGARARDELR